MKKIIVGLVLFFAVSQVASAQTQETTTQTTKYYYYPEQNVYLNEATGHYWYLDNAKTTWTDVVTLPDTYKIMDNSPRYEVTYNGNEVWKQNKDHQMKYKVKKDGTIKTKSKS